MSLDPTDLRANLPTMRAASPTPGGPTAAPEFHVFEVAATGTSSDVYRGQNLLVEYSIVTADHPLTGPEDPDESVVLGVADDAEITVEWAGDQAVLRGIGLVVVPPGSHTVRVRQRTHVVRLFTPTVTERADRAANAASYDTPHPNVAPLVPWPAPLGEPRLRVYRFADAPADPTRFGCIFRTRAFMVNFLPNDGPRDEAKLSPHAHDDFEQLSLAVTGDWVHHIRTSWTPNKVHWRADLHQALPSPSITVIPPPTIHTSQSVNPGPAFLIDLFSPPRADFSERAGWVLDAEDYPMP